MCPAWVVTASRHINTVSSHPHFAMHRGGRNNDAATGDGHFHVFTHGLPLARLPFKLVARALHPYFSDKSSIHVTWRFSDLTREPRPRRR